VYLQMVIKGKLSTVSITKGRGCPGPYTKRKHRTKGKRTRKHIKHSTNSKGRLSEGEKERDRLAQWSARLGKATRWVPEAWVGRRVILAWLR
jgi:hypothetical protein